MLECFKSQTKMKIEKVSKIIDSRRRGRVLRPKPDARKNQKPQGQIFRLDGRIYRKL